MNSYQMNCPVSNGMIMVNFCMTHYCWKCLSFHMPSAIHIKMCKVFCLCFFVCVVYFLVKHKADMKDPITVMSYNCHNLLARSDRYYSLSVELWWPFVTHHVMKLFVVSYSESITIMQRSKIQWHETRIWHEYYIYHCMLIVLSHFNYKLMKTGPCFQQINRSNVYATSAI